MSPSWFWFYKQYPAMSPYVGANYGRQRSPSLLLIGESHYLPADSSLDTSPSAWYSGSEGDLNPDELGFVNTAEIIRESRQSGFANRAHSIWRNSFEIINQSGPKYPDLTLVADDIAFYNFFLRPAATGLSLDVQPRDVEVANEAFEFNTRALSPDVVVFLSSLAWNHLRQPSSCNTTTISVPHPGCAWWNRRAKKYGGRRGKDVLES